MQVAFTRGVSLGCSKRNLLVVVESAQLGTCSLVQGTVLIRRSFCTRLQQSSCGVFLALQLVHLNQGAPALQIVLYAICGKISCADFTSLHVASCDVRICFVNSQPTRVARRFVSPLQNT